MVFLHNYKQYCLFSHISNINIKYSYDKKYLSFFCRIKFTLSTIFDGTFHLEILKESLLKAIDDIDAAFCKVSGYCFFYVLPTFVNAWLYPLFHCYFVSLHRIAEFILVFMTLWFVCCFLRRLLDITLALAPPQQLY